MGLILKLRNIIAGIIIPILVAGVFMVLFSILYLFGAPTEFSGEISMLVMGILYIIVAILIERKISKKYFRWSFGLMLVGTVVTGLAWLVGLLLSGL